MSDLEKMDLHRSLSGDNDNDDVVNMKKNNNEADKLDFRDEGDFLQKMKKKLDSGSIGEKILKSQMDGDPDIVAVGEGLRRCVVGNETLVSEDGDGGKDSGDALLEIKRW